MKCSVSLIMGTHFTATVAKAFVYHHEKDITEHFFPYLALYKRVIDDILLNGVRSKTPFSVDFLGALYSKTDRVKRTYCTSDISISCLDLPLRRDASTSVLQFSTFQKPLNKYLYVSRKADQV